jgi:hypothetical protein
MDSKASTIGERACLIVVSIGDLGPDRGTDPASEPAGPGRDERLAGKLIGG